MSGVYAVPSFHTSNYVQPARIFSRVLFEPKRRSGAHTYSMMCLVCVLPQTWSMTSEKVSVLTSSKVYKTSMDWKIENVMTAIPQDFVDVGDRRESKGNVRTPLISVGPCNGFFLVCNWVSRFVPLTVL